mgnify:CR=1 FL=1
MKILSVIPARAGSKGIPNKNIRIVGGKPLIYYSINNALKSKYITDIIVTTDSESVKLIAKQMKVDVKNRDKSLSGDDITLDSVIYDAIPKDEQWDYIITMQPTSPTLKPETLDKAIEYTINNNLDTVISVINAPHLSWREENGKKVPNYKERLNRQYLPPCYMETGAFVISKYTAVSEKSRIGNLVDVYEISENESQDVDNFADLQSVALTLNSSKVAIYVNGNNKRGTGHIYRALEMADEFFCKPDIFFDINQTDRSIFGNTTYNLVPVNGVVDLFEKCRKEKYTIFINDILSTSLDYMLGLKSALPKNAKIINFEDDGEGIIKADAVFNALYDKSEYENIYSGEKYYICPKSLLLYNPIEIKEKVKTVLITFGGADPRNYTDRILKMIIKDEYKNYNFIVVLGKAKENVNELFKYNEYKNISILHNIENMPEIMSKADLAITSRGRTGYELAILGVPTIAMAQNKREEKHSFVCEENGFNYIGLNPTDEIIEGTLKMYLELSKESRQKIQKKLLSHNLTNGRDRIINIINSL